VYREDELLSISALQHLLFCERQCALIHIERAWAENRLTAEGRVLHERTHEPGTESRGAVRSATAVRLRSLRLGLVGQADVVEFHRVEAPGGAAGAACGVRLQDTDGWWTPFPVEYKRGAPKTGDCDRVQLCAQALCLEEMLGVPAPAGAIFYGAPRRREEVEFTPDLRSATEAAAARAHELVRSGVTPPAKYEKKCDRCSLIDICLPKSAGAKQSVGAYLERIFSDFNP
jgi:CRISPR-associated exonuclease Cas4